MPNHCETDLTLTGSKELLDKVLAAHFTEEGELNCDSVISYPANLKALDEAAAAYEKAHPDNPWGAGRPKDGFNSGGYEWCIKNWGTKWGTYEGQGVNRGPRSANLSFQSAWSPPHPVLDRLAALYPELSITAKSYEQGAAYQCDFRWKGGERIKSENKPYHGHRGG